MKTVGSDAFLHELVDASAALVFPHFSFGGWKEHYTGYCPLWRLSYALPLFSPGLEREISWDVQALMLIPGKREIAFFDPVYIREVIGRVVLRVIVEQGQNEFFEWEETQKELGKQEKE